MVAWVATLTYVSKTQEKQGANGSLLLINSVHTRCIVKTSGFTRAQGAFVKIGDFIKFKGFL